jgi:hypothetical protein
MFIDMGSVAALLREKQSLLSSHLLDTHAAITNRVEQPN